MRVKLSGGQITEAANGEPAGEGWMDPRPTAKPDDTDEGTWVEGVEVVDGEPVQTWTLRPWTAAEMAAVSPERLDQLEVAGRSRGLRDAARTALTANDAYLSLSPPTTAQAVAQVAALTRQTNTLIRLFLNA